MVGYIILGFFLGCVALTIFNFFLTIKETTVTYRYDGTGYNILHKNTWLVEPIKSESDKLTSSYNRGKVLQSIKDSSIIFVKEDDYNKMFHKI